MLYNVQVDIIINKTKIYCTTRRGISILSEEKVFEKYTTNNYHQNYKLLSTEKLNCISISNTVITIISQEGKLQSFPIAMQFQAKTIWKVSKAPCNYNQSDNEMKVF